MWSFLRMVFKVGLEILGLEKKNVLKFLMF